MKQLLLMLIIAGSALTVSAQRNSDYHHNDRYHYKDNRHDRRDIRHKPIKKREMERQMAVINRDYNARIAYIKGHPGMKRREKSREIKKLEKQRHIALDQCRERFMGRMHRTYVIVK